MQLVAQLTVPRDARFVATIRRLLGGVMDVEAAPPETVHELKLAVSEACANVIRHAEGSGTYDVVVQLGEQECEITVVDGGPGFDPQPADLRPSQAVDEDGRGLALISGLVEELDIDRLADGMQVRFTKSW
jgi:serine/threonine-protein kinase RsbW